jgi:hypothetical protein
MNLPRVEIVEGEVVKVQLSSETHVEGRAKARADDQLLISSKVVNHMRLFLVGADGKERDFQFSNTTVAIREGHQIALARAKPAGGQWVTIALHNRTTGLREERIGAFAEAARQKRIPARWRAAIWAIVVGLIYWPLSEMLHLRGRGLGIAVAIGVLAFPLAWLFTAMVDAIVLPGRERDAEKMLRQAIEEKLGGGSPPPPSSSDLSVS